MNAVLNPSVDVAEVKRTEVEISSTSNPLGEAVAQFVMAFNDAVTDRSASPAKRAGIVFRGFRVENDAQYGDHIKIDGMRLYDESAGLPTTRMVIIHNAPKGITRHTVRFVNFNLDDEVFDYHFAQIGKLVQQTINYILTGDMDGDD